MGLVGVLRNARMPDRYPGEPRLQSMSRADAYSREKMTFASGARTLASFNHVSDWPGAVISQASPALAGLSCPQSIHF